MCLQIRRDGESEKFCKTFWKLKKAKQIYCSYLVIKGAGLPVHFVKVSIKGLPPPLHCIISGRLSIKRQANFAVLQNPQFALPPIQQMTCSTILLLYLPTIFFLLRIVLGRIVFFLKKTILLGINSLRRMHLLSLRPCLVAKSYLKIF